MIVHSSINAGRVHRLLYITKHRLEVTGKLPKLFMEAEKVLSKLGEMEISRAEFLLQRKICRNHVTQLLLQAT